MAGVLSGRHRGAHVFVHDIVRLHVPTVREHSPITVAVDELVRSGLGSLPVLDANGLLAGVVSEGDLLRFAVGTRHEPLGTPASPAGGPAGHTAAYRLNASRHVVAEVMTRNPVTATEQQPVDDLARLFVRLPWRTLPVVRLGRLVGVVTRSDVVEALLCEAEVVPPLAGSPE
jgi:CBS domain-containing protein